MNPVDWEAVQRLQRSLHPDQLSGVQNRRENGDWDTYCPNSRYTADGTMEADMGWKGLSPPPQNFYIKESEAEDSDGQPLEINEEDAELSRKRQQLKEIEEQILQKRVAIALKTVKPFVKETCDEQPATCGGATLRHRVDVILQQRRSLGCVTQVRSPKERLNTSRLSKEGLLQEDHWLKRRVKALMKQRCGVLPSHREVPDVTPPPPSHSVAPPASEGHSVGKGFQHFLAVLNKGVDIDLLSRIVTDDHVDLVNFQPPASENKSDPPFRSESQPSTSVERKIDLPSQERLPPHDDDDRGSRSKSPPAVKKKEEPKVDKQQEHLQNILKTLGFSLEVEEMSKLADRTQERLYGKKKHEELKADQTQEKLYGKKKHEDLKADQTQERLYGKKKHEDLKADQTQERLYGKKKHEDLKADQTQERLYGKKKHEDLKADSREKQESPQKGSQKCSRSSSTSTSTSTSRPSHHTHSGHSKRRQESGSRGSRDRSRDADGLTRQDSNQDSKKTLRGDSNETSSYQHPYPQAAVYPQLHPAAFPGFPGYTATQDYQYNSYYSGSYSTGSHLYPSSSYPQQQATCSYGYDFQYSAGAPEMVYPEFVDLEDTSLLLNPDLGTSEGQMGLRSGSRCLQVINTKPPPTSNLKLVKKCRKKKKSEMAKKKRKALLRQKKQDALKKKKKKLEAPANYKDESEMEELEEEEQLPTVLEIKANLRKKLVAFNLKVKQKQPQPATSPTPPTPPTS